MSKQNEISDKEFAIEQGLRYILRSENGVSICRKVVSKSKRGRVKSKSKTR